MPPPRPAPAHSATQSLQGVIGLQRTSWLPLLLTFLVVLSPHIVLTAMDLGRQTQPVRVVTPAVSAPWRAVTEPPSTWLPAFQNASSMLNVGLVDALGKPVGLHISYYRQQDYERKLVSSENVLVKSNDAAWARAVGGNAVNAVLLGTPLHLESAVLRQQTPNAQDANQRLLAWRFYWVNGTFTASDYVGKIQGALGRIRGWGDDGANIVVYTPWPDAESQTDAVMRLQAYLDTQGEALAAALRQTRERD